MFCSVEGLLRGQQGHLALQYDDSSVITDSETSAPQTNKLPLYLTASDEGICLNASVSVRTVMAVDMGFHIVKEKQCGYNV